MPRASPQVEVLKLLALGLGVGEDQKCFLYINKTHILQCRCRNVLNGSLVLIEIFEF